MLLDLNTDCSGGSSQQADPVKEADLQQPLAKGFGIVNKAGLDVFLELYCFFYDPTDVGNLISGSSAFSKSHLNIWKFTVHVLLKPRLENFERYFASMGDEYNCAVV